MKATRPLFGVLNITLAFAARVSATWILPVLLLLALPAVMQAQFNYAITTNLTITLTGYTGPGGSVTIPDTIQGLPVTAIGSAAFHSATTLTSITVPDSVTNIGDYAFNACSSLTNVTLGKGVTTIGYQAFEYCTSLTNLSIPDNVVNLGDWAFSYGGLLSVTISGVTNPGAAFVYCTKLESVTIGSNAVVPGFTGCGNLLAINVVTNNPYYSSIDGVLFDKNQRTLLEYPIHKAGTYTIPVTVTTIGPYAFYYCAGLTNISIPNSVTYIGEVAFGDCSGLLSLVIPNGVTNIGYSAFGSCTNLTSLTIGNGVGTIGHDAFSWCSGLTNITIPDSVTDIDYEAFAGCSSLANLTLSKNLARIGYQAFEYCTSLGSVSIPSGVIEFWAFLNCTGLTNVTIGPNVNFSQDIFLNCSSLMGIYFQGNAPTLQPGTVFGADRSIVYYLPGTTGWGSTFAGRPALPINMQIQVGDTSFGIRTNQFGFTFTGSYGLTLVVEAATNLTNPFWYPLQTNTITGSSTYFSDSTWTNYPNRFYRLRWP